MCRATRSSRRAERPAFGSTESAGGGLCLGNRCRHAVSDTTALSTALNFVSQQRVVVDNSLTRLTAATDAASSEQTQLTRGANEPDAGGRGKDLDATIDGGDTTDGA